MARRKVKKVKSLEETATELRKTRQEMGYRKPQTIMETNTKTGKKKSITLGAKGETYGATGMGQLLRKKAKRKKTSKKG